MRSGVVTSSSFGGGTDDDPETSSPSATSNASRIARAEGNRFSGVGSSAFRKNAASPVGWMSSSETLGAWPGSGTRPSKAWRPA
jgi:hypothetical protein